MRTPPELLRIEGLSVRRGDAVLLQDIHWTLRRGEHWVILGPNGCGKTTLLKTLVGYMSASGGTLELLGHRYGETDWRDLRFRIGLVSSALQASIPPAETGQETVISGRYAQLDLWKEPTQRDRREAQRLLRSLQAGDLTERPWLYLSQGERQRVLIARALMARPALLILDEPCAGLDPVARADFLDTIDHLARRRSGPGIILVTHHVEEITSAFTHALALRRGQIEAAGFVRQVVTSTTLSRVFDASLQVTRTADTFRATVHPPGKRG